MPKQESKNVYKSNRAMVRGRLTIQATADTDAIRHETLAGDDHLVVPIVALVEGVLFPSNAPFPELALASEFGRVPDGWNGRPIVFDHPEINGVHVSANSPEVSETEIFGQMFNTRIESGKLKTEAWINLVRVSELRDEVQDAVTRLESGEVSEVSTGLFTALEEVEGIFEGQEFGGIWREVVPDHLAILPKGTIGASSVAAGAGAPRLNAERVLNVTADASDKKGFFHSLGDKVLETLGFRAQGISDGDLRMALNIALEAMFPEEFVWVVSVFSGDNFFIHEKGFNSKLLKRTFEMTDDGAVTISAEAEDVRPVTSFVPATEKEDGVMSISAEKVTALITNSVTAFTEDDREFLQTLSEAQFIKLEELAVNAATALTEAAPKEEEAAPDDELTANEKQPTDETVDAFISQAPAEMQEMLSAGLRLHRDNKVSLIKGIRANKNNSFSEEVLGAMDLETLEHIGALANVSDYSGQAPVANTGSSEDVNMAPEPIPLFTQSN